MDVNVVDIDVDCARLRNEIIQAHEKLKLLRSALYNIHDHAILDLIKMEEQILEIQKKLGIKQEAKTSKCVYRFK